MSLRKVHPNFRSIVVIAVGLALLLPVPIAAAQVSGSSDPTAAQYGLTPESNTGSQTGHGGATTGGSTSTRPGGTPVADTASARPVSSLPFTGLDLASMATVALCLLAGGLAIARFSRPRRG